MAGAAQGKALPSAAAPAMRQPRGSPYKLARSGRVTSMQDSSRPGNQVVYQDTFLDLGLLAPVLDEVMAAAGIPPMPPRAGAQP